MKRIFIAAMTLVLAVFSSCTKEEMNVSGNGFAVNFNVEDKAGFENETKAAQSGWETGDQILMVFQYKNGGWLGWGNCNNTLRLTKTASGWDVDNSKLDINDLKSGDKYMAFHHKGNITLPAEWSGDDMTTNLNGYKGGAILKDDNNTFTVVDGVLDLGTISMQRISHTSQVSVKNLTGENWKMTIFVNESDSRDGITITHLQKNKAYIYNAPGTGHYGVYENATGLEYGGDVVFAFRITSINNSVTKLVFKLTDGTKTYRYTVNDVTPSTLVADKAYYLPAISDPKWVEQI